MKLYSIAKWSDLFENNRSKKVEKLSWVPIPNRHDGENYSALITHQFAAEIFAAWVLVIQVASKCHPRGRLVRGDGKPHDPGSLSLKTRAPAIWFSRCLTYLEANTDWLAVEEVAVERHPSATQVTSEWQAGDEEQNGMEQNGMEDILSGKSGFVLNPQETDGKPKKPKKPRLQSLHPDTRTALHWLNEKSGRRYRECESSMKPISDRLSEDGVDIGGVKRMIARQSRKWKGDTMEAYLRPETLFGKQKFDGYYAARDLPIEEAKPQARNAYQSAASDPGPSPAYQAQQKEKLNDILRGIPRC